MVIDMHGHYIPILEEPYFKELFEIATKDFDDKFIKVKGRVVGKLDEGLISIKKQVKDMDRTRIDLRVICVAPFMFFYELENEKLIELAKALNEQMFKDTVEYDDRFLCLATLPMKNIEEACVELEKVMISYNFVGAQIATNIDGKELDDLSLNPFWEKAQSLGALILLHPHYTVGKERFCDYHLRNVIGNPLDTTIAAMRIILGGVLKRYPNLKICLSHSGGYLPLGIYRLDKAYVERTELSHLDALPSESLSKFYYDSITFNSEALEYVIDTVGVDRVLMGTDYPFDMGDLDPIMSINRLNITEKNKKLILSENARSILNSTHHFNLKKQGI